MNSFASLYANLFNFFRFMLSQLLLNEYFTALHITFLPHPQNSLTGNNSPCFFAIIISNKSSPIFIFQHQRPSHCTIFAVPTFFSAKEVPNNRILSSVSNSFFGKRDSGIIIWFYNFWALSRALNFSRYLTESVLDLLLAIGFSF